MGRDISKRLGQLSNRRKGLDRTAVMAGDSLQKSLIKESYEKRSAKPNTTYVLGAMDEVGTAYTAVSIGEAKRVEKQLRNGFNAVGKTVDFRLQGSVPANLHIRGASDVDLLLIDDAFFTYDEKGGRAMTGQFNSPVTYTPLSALQGLRSRAETILSDAFPAATIDKSGAKAVKVSGGSLQREVDVVPSHWHDTIEYQLYQIEVYRGIKIFDKSKNETLLNLPFLHIKRIDERDQTARTGLKKAIRLCKNVKSDAREDGIEIQLSSFDIASAMWHADLRLLALGTTVELAILAETRRHLSTLSSNHAAAKLLDVPDGSRKVFDSDIKLRALDLLANEINDLAVEVALEHGEQALQQAPSWERIEKRLRETAVPLPWL